MGFFVSSTAETELGGNGRAEGLTSVLLHGRARQGQWGDLPVLCGGRTEVRSPGWDRVSRYPVTLTDLLLLM